VISIIVINYKKPELAIGLCQSLATLEGREQVRVLIVDNAADDSSRTAFFGLSAESRSRGLSVEFCMKRPTGLLRRRTRRLEHLRKSGLPGVG